MQSRIYILSLIILFFLLQGCVALNSFPKLARSGGTITLAVGSPDYMTKSNTTVQYISNSDLDNPINLPIRAILKLRPDNTSFLLVHSTFQ